MSNIFEIIHYFSEYFCFSFFRWLNRDQVLEESAIEFDHRTNSVLGLNEDGICVVEIRDENGTVR